jgi:hypothetical protein
MREREKERDQEREREREVIAEVSDIILTGWEVRIEVMRFPINRIWKTYEECKYGDEPGGKDDL